MKEITKNIKERQFYKVYLLTGDEGYRLLQAKTLLKNALVQDGDEMNFTQFEESKIDWNSVKQTASTFPFFAEKRVLLFNQTNAFKTGKEELVAIFEEIPETTCIIICEAEVDKRSKAYKWIKKNGYVAEFLKKNENEKAQLHFLVQLLGRAQKRIREEDARYFLSIVGEDLFQIRNEAEKLIGYLGEEEIATRDAIDAVVSEQIQDKIFDLVTCIAQKNQKAALKYYNDLLLLKEPAMHILYLIVRQYRILILLKSMGAKRMPDAEMAKIAGIPPFSVKKYGSQLRMYRAEQLEECLRSAVQLETEIKTGKITDQIGLELLIISLSR